MSRTVGVLVVLLLALSGTAAAVPALAAPASCSTPWGSTPEDRAVGHGAPIVAVRAGSNACFDRLVFETAGPPGGFTVQYVDVVTQDGSGKPLVVPGGPGCRSCSTARPTTRPATTRAVEPRTSPGSAR